MSKIGGLRIKNLSQLVDVKLLDEKQDIKDEQRSESDIEFVASTTPVKSVKERPATKKSKKPKPRTQKKTPVDSINAIEEDTTTPSKKIKTTTKKHLPPDQTKIDSFFKSCSKTYKLPPNSEIKSAKGSSLQEATPKKRKTTSGKRTKHPTLRKRGKGRKRLFDDTTSETTETTTSLSCFAEKVAPKSNRKRKSPVKKTVKTRHAKQMKPMQDPAVCIDLCSESEEELGVIFKAESNVDIEDKATTQQIPPQCPETGEITPPPCTKQKNFETTIEKSKVRTKSPMVSIALHANMHLKIPSPPTSTSDDTSAESFPTAVKAADAPILQPTIIDVDSFENEPAKAWNGPRCKKRTCPTYKVVAGTTFGVDGFQFGPIKGVTHYFLSHFHADHYIGLTRKFTMPLYLSGVTARLLRIFIPIDEKFLHIMELNEPQVIDNVEVTAIDANHCPGAIMFIFKLPTGKCILHTGDFRASPNMESEPAFWNNDIHTIYLDTTYISNKYAFCTQDESIAEAFSLIKQFQDKHVGKKILYICGAYLIGKEKFWTAIAHKFKLTVWTEPKRAKALHAMADSNIKELLNMDPNYTDMHVITMMKINYFSLVEYFEAYSSIYDLCLAIRPSGWEKNSKPQYRGKINIIGIEYSEHSSYNEMQRFVTYLKPKEVISTVPVSGDLMITSKVPEGWYKYDKFPCHRNWQPTIMSYLKLQTHDTSSNKKISEKNQITETCTPPEVEDKSNSPKISPTKLSLEVGYGCDADDDWLS